MYPRLLELGPITVYTYGVLLAAAYLFGLQLARIRAKERGLDANRVLDLGIYIIISALIGAKLLLLITDFKTFTSNPRELMTLARSGGIPRPSRRSTRPSAPNDAIGVPVFRSSAHSQLR